MNVTQLRDTITTLLAASPNLIGLYTLPNGSKVPSVYVIGRQGVPPEFKAEGLEVSMREFPERLPQSGLGAVKVLQLWEIMLVQYTPSASNLSSAMDRMISRFPDATLRYLPGDDVAYERCRIIVPDMIVKPLAPR